MNMVLELIAKMLPSAHSRGTAVQGRPFTLENALHFLGSWTPRPTMPRERSSVRILEMS